VGGIDKPRYAATNGVLVNYDVEDSLNAATVRRYVDTSAAWQPGTAPAEEAKRKAAAEAVIRGRIDRFGLDGSVGETFSPGIISSGSTSNSLTQSEAESLRAGDTIVVSRTNGSIGASGGIKTTNSFAARVLNSSNGLMAYWPLHEIAGKAEASDVWGGWNGVTNSAQLAREVNGGVLPNAATTNGWSMAAQVVTPADISRYIGDGITSYPTDSVRYFRRTDDASPSANQTAPKLGDVPIVGDLFKKRIAGATVPPAGTALQSTGTPTPSKPSGIYLSGAALSETNSLAFQDGNQPNTFEFALESPTTPASPAPPAGPAAGQ
jgi:hypothetical protein